MITTKSKTLRITLALIVALALCLGSFTTAMADEVITGTSYASPADVPIVKNLEVPTYTSLPTPALTFTFTFTAVTTGAPSITSKSVTFTPGSAGGTGTTGGYGTLAQTTGIDTYTKNTDGIFGASGTIAWPASGVYEYTVTETASTNTVGANETVTYSTQTYTLRPYVAADSTGLFVKYIEVLNSSGEKVDPTPGSSEFIFTNKYYKHNGVSGSANTLYIEKTVSGNMGDTVSYFDFSATITRNSLVPSANGVYRGYVVTASGVPVAGVSATTNGAPDGTDATLGSYFTFDTSTGSSTRTFKLKDGQKLAFYDTHVGTGYEVTETSALGHTVTTKVKTNNVEVTDTNGTGPEVVGETANGNGVKFDNYKSITVPTGLNVESLPYYLLVLLMLAAITAYVVMRRKRDYKNE
jgi:hypothetical protein